MARPQPPTVKREIWIDGEFVPWADATVHVLSHSLQRGSLVFDYMSVHATPRGPALFRLSDHVVRLFQSVSLVGLPLTLDAAAIERAVVETVRRNPGASAVKVSAFLPAIEVDVVPADDHVSVAIAAYDPAVDVNAHKVSKPHRPKELRIWIEKEIRNRRKDIMPPQAKVAANYTSPMAAKWRARRAGYDEILLVDEQGYVAEGPTTNVFLVDANGTLLTPPEDEVLQGITRRTILDIAAHDCLPAAEERFRPEALIGAAEAFLTGTTAGVWPISSVDGKALGDGKPGPISTVLRQRFLQITAGLAPEFDHWLTYTSEG